MLHDIHIIICCFIMFGEIFEFVREEGFPMIILDL